MTGPTVHPVPSSGRGSLPKSTSRRPLPTQNNLYNHQSTNYYKNLTNQNSPNYDSNNNNDKNGHKH